MSMTINEVGDMVRAYLECALWSSTDDDGTPLDTNYDIDDISEAAQDLAAKECKRFITDNLSDLADMKAEQAGHDFWLTRNGHGAGFWDRGLGRVGDRLSDAAHLWGCSDIYMGDDKFLHISSARQIR
jgi:hypothetical protein